jgi:hypothetical protein
MGLKEIAKRYTDCFDLTPQDVIENIYPVSLGSRCAALSRHSSYEDGHSRYPTKEELQTTTHIRMRKALSVDFGAPGLDAEYIIKTTSLGCVAYATCFFVSDDAILAEIDEINRLFKAGWEGINTGRTDEALFEAAWRESGILGIPACCAQSYANEFRDRMAKLNDIGFERVVEVGKAISTGDGQYRGDQDFARKVRQTGGMTERRSRLQLNKIIGKSVEHTSSSANKPDMFTRLPDDILYSYFAFEVYPCKPGCSEAAARGREVEESLTRKDPVLGKVYREKILPANAYRIWSGQPTSLVSAHTAMEISEMLHESDVADVMAVFDQMLKDGK